MAFFIIILILLSTVPQAISAWLPVFIAKYSNLLQQKCFSLFPPSSYQSFHYALFCGGNTLTYEHKELLIKSSLYHLVVVSGAHLIFFMNLFQFFIKKGESLFNIWVLDGILVFLLTIYTLATGFQPPVVRALIALLLKLFSRKGGWNWNESLIHFLSVGLVLVLMPHWLFSLSLLLSSVSSLGLLYGKGLVLFWNYLQKNHFLASLLLHSVVFIFCLPMICFSGAVHPLGIIFNLVIAVLFANFLLPLELILAFIPSFSPVMEMILDIFFSVLKFFTQSISISYEPPLFSLFYWVYWLVLWFLFYFLFQLHRRSHWQFYSS